MRIIAILAIRLTKFLLTAFSGAILGGAVFNTQKTLAFCIVLGLVIATWIGEWSIKNDSKSLNNVLNSIYKIVKSHCGGDIRCTIWMPCRFKKETLKQILHYIPAGYGKGRKLHQSKGIVGRCFREKRILSEHLEQDKDFKKYMVENWGFTVKDAEQLSLDRRSYMSLPILNKDRDSVLGVVYFDSDKLDEFEPEIANIVELFLPILGDNLAATIKMEI